VPKEQLKMAKKIFVKKNLVEKVGGLSSPTLSCIIYFAAIIK
jgi:hypothetical protein